MNTPTNPVVPSPFTPEEEKHVVSMVGAMVSAKLAEIKRITKIVTAILTPILIFLGYHGVNQLRDRWNEKQTEIIKKAADDRLKLYEEGFKTQLAVFVEGQKQTYSLFSSAMEQDRNRLKDETFKTIKDAADRSAENRQKLEQFVNEQKELIAAIRTQIETEVTNAVATRTSLSLVKEAALNSAEGLKGQLVTAEAMSARITSQLEQMNERCVEIRTKSEELDKMIGDVRPKMEAIRTILADSKAAEIFSKLQQDFTRVRSLEVRISYAFPASVNQPVLPFDGLWLKKNGQPFLQLYNLREKNTIIRGSDEVVEVSRYVLFAPHEMTIEGQPLSHLTDIDAVDIYFRINPKELLEEDPVKGKATYEKFIGAFQEGLSKLVRVRVQILVNGYSSFEKEVQLANLNVPKLPEEMDKEWERSLVLPVAELFKDPEAYYSRQFAVQTSKAVGP